MPLHQPHTKRKAWLPQWLPHKTAATRKLPLTPSFLVELRGFEPLTPSMRTRCATGLRYSPWNASQTSKCGDFLLTGDCCGRADGAVWLGGGFRASPGGDPAVRHLAQASPDHGPLGGRDRVAGRIPRLTVGGQPVCAQNALELAADA